MGFAADYAPSGVEGDALVSFKNVASLQKLVGVKPLFHKTPVTEVMFCDLRWGASSQVGSPRPWSLSQAA